MIKALQRLIRKTRLLICLVKVLLQVRRKNRKAAALLAARTKLRAAALGNGPASSLPLDGRPWHSRRLPEDPLLPQLPTNPLEILNNIYGIQKTAALSLSCLSMLPRLLRIGTAARLTTGKPSR